MISGSDHIYVTHRTHNLDIFKDAIHIVIAKITYIIKLSVYDKV